ncbi:DALR domain-containing protein, partial [Rhodopseudomonas sp. B29]|uniref:DALR domain-containing protein n=1 Tax=Rhodopseudomonas sp. B29 TaxID=95607 RepID=UPI001900E800
MKALSDDLNTPRAIAELHRLAKFAREGDARTKELMTNSVATLDLTVQSARNKVVTGLRLLGIDSGI